jgi:hypothetical protein
LGLAAASALPRPADAASSTLTIKGEKFQVLSVTTADSLRSLANSPNFCKIWPEVKQGLQFLSSILKGPWGPVYQGVIAILIGIGDAACPS